MFGFKNTKMFKSICLILACSILFSSCHTIRYVSLQDEYNNQLKDKNYAERVEMLGPPDRTAPDGKGGEILIYEIKSQQGYSAKGKYTNTINLTETKKQTNIFLNEDKICYNVKSDDVRPEKVFSVGRTIGLVVPVTIGGILILLSAAAEESTSNY